MNFAVHILSVFLFFFRFCWSNFNNLLYILIFTWPLFLLFFVMTNSNAERVGWWELTVLASHVHPSVAAWATKLLVGVNIEYGGNPLTDFTIGSFLDKFMEKKPRQATWRGPSEIEPAKKVSCPEPESCHQHVVLSHICTWLDETQI